MKLDSLKSGVREVWTFVKRYLLRAPNCYRLAFLLVVGFIGLQGVEIVSAGTPYRIALLGVEGTAPCVLVGVIAFLLILAQAIGQHLWPFQLEIVRQVLMLRERGLTLPEIQESLSAPAHWISAIHGAVTDHTASVRDWSTAKLLEVVRSTEFAACLQARLPTADATAATGKFLSMWVKDRHFRDQFVDIGDVLGWLQTN